MGNRTITSGKTTIYKDIVICLDNRTGKEIWLYAYSCDRRDYPGPMSTPVVDGSRLYTISRKGHLFCFNALNGKMMWKKNMITDGLTQSPDWDFAFSPVIEGDLLILNVGKSGVVLNKKNGKVIWKSAPEQGGLATPVLFNFGEKRLAAIQGHDTIHIVDIKTGKVQWTIKWKSYADPIFFNSNLIYLSASRSHTTSCALLKITNGELEVLWCNKKRNSAFQSWVILNGYGYGFKRSSKQYLQCIEIKTGKEKWAKQVVNWGSLMASNGKLIILYGEGDLVIAEASPGGYKEISRVKLFKIQNWRSYRRRHVNCCWTAPVLSNRRIYCRDTYGDLICVDMK
jgi:outer membrane protein assembly factor BamB